MWENCHTGTPIPAEEAWRRFDDWKSARKEIGIWFVSKAGSTVGLCTVHSVRNGRLELRGDGMKAWFNLRQAELFTYGPLQTWPRWPMGPIVEVIAVQAYMNTGEWLVLAEGLPPEGLSPNTLPPLSLPE